MTITLDITPETRTELERQAAAEGRPLEAYVASLLEEAAKVSGGAPRSAPVPAKDMVELFAPLRGLNLEFERDRDTGRDLQL